MSESDDKFKNVDQALDRLYESRYQAPETKAEKFKSVRNTMNELRKLQELKGMDRVSKAKPIFIGGSQEEKPSYPVTGTFEVANCVLLFVMGFLLA